MAEQHTGGKLNRKDIDVHSTTRTARPQRRSSSLPWATSTSTLVVQARGQ